MNKENLNTLLRYLKSQDYFDKHKVGFNMDLIFGPVAEYCPDLTGNNCGTIACIAGHCNFIRSGFNPAIAFDLSKGITIGDNAGGWLGLDLDLTDALFYPPQKLKKGPFLEWNLISLKDVIELLEKIRNEEITKPKEIEDFYINIMTNKD